MDDSTTQQQHPVVTGMFKDRDSAERAFDAARTRGYSDRDIDVVMSDATRSKYFGNGDGKGTELGNKAAEGAGIGAGIGGTVGAIAAAVAAVGTSIAIPGLGLVIAGPLAAALAGAGAGGAAGTLVGALVGWTIPDEHLKEYETGLRDGGILLGVRPRSTDDAQHLSTQWRADTASSTSAADTASSRL